MNKRCPSNYWAVCYNPNNDKYGAVPYSGRHWYLILKAAVKLGSIGKEAMAAYKESIEELLSNEPGNKFMEAIDFNKCK